MKRSHPPSIAYHPHSEPMRSQYACHPSHGSPPQWRKLAIVMSLFSAFALTHTSCSTQVKAEERYHYQFEHGKTAIIQNGVAWAPTRAPDAVHRAIAAGNALQGRPYRYGGGHASFEDSGYDCSGTVSYLLHKAGLLDRTMTSKEFLTWGKKGRGKWITIYAREGHVFMTIAGLRIDTGGTKRDTGPQWKPFSRRTSKFVVRHPPGL